jgi:hypothetical protein
MMTHVSHSGSFELRLTHCDERLTSEGDKHIHWVFVCLLFVEEEIDRKETVFGTNSTFKHVAQGETL